MKKYLIVVLSFSLLRCMEKNNITAFAPFPDPNNKPRYEGGWFKLNEFEEAPTNINQWFELYGPVNKPYDISDLCKATLLRNLFKEARVHSFLNDKLKNEILTDEEIKRIIESKKPINDIKGRILKIVFSDATINLYDYMIYNGRKAAETALINTKTNKKESCSDHVAK